jgi:hypothetical protein
MGLVPKALPVALLTISILFRQPLPRQRFQHRVTS